MVDEDQINAFAAANKDAWRVVRNSYSTPRQLREALSSLMPTAPQSELPPPQSQGEQYERGSRLNRNQIQDVMRQAGWPPELIREMSAVSLAESGGDAGIDTVRSGLDPQRRNEYSVGLFQINYAVHKPMLDQMGISEADLRDPLTNARVALKIYQMQGKQAWGAYTNGSYRQYL